MIKKYIFPALLLFSVPFIYFYPFSIPLVATSLFLGWLLKKLLIGKTNYVFIGLFLAAIVFAVFISGHKIYSDIAIENVTNSQRGEHPNFQASLVAKVLHNKPITAGMYYLKNLSDRLSLSTIFASGLYPNLSKYLPLGFLYPWYLIGFIIFVSSRYKEYLNPIFILASVILLSFASLFTTESAAIFMFALIWFINFVSVEELLKLPRKFLYAVLFLNLVYLLIFISSFKVFLSQ